MNWSLTRAVVSITSAWVSGWSSMPAAVLVAHGVDFEDAGHADEIGSDCFQEANLSGRLEVGPPRRL
jgi:hypothetical protein